MTSETPAQKHNTYVHAETFGFHFHRQYDDTHWDNRTKEKSSVEDLEMIETLNCRLQLLLADEVITLKPFNQISRRRHTVQTRGHDVQLGFHPNKRVCEE